MRKTWIGFLMILGALWLAQAALAADPENDRISTDRRRGEEDQIQAREEWFSRQRGLDELYRPAELRAKAIEDVGLALAAQPELAVAGSWQVVGPSPMTMLSWTMGRVAGRVSALAVSPSSEQVLYLGTASGGLWKTLDGGTTWSAAFDTAGTQTIGSVAIDPNNSSVVWVGTGEQANRCSSYFGMGVFRSTDAGATFEARNGSGASTLDLSYVNAVAVQPGNSNVVLAGGAGFCSGGVLAGSALYRSTDAGASWSSVLTGQANDVIFDPNNPSVVYAAIGSFLDTVNAGVFKSTDGGANWTLLNNGILSGASARRIRLAMAPTNASILYALVGTSSTNARLYRTLNAGSSWSQRNASACDGQCSYNLTLAVSPASSDTVLVGAVRLYRSTNGGTSLSALTTAWGSSQKVHQDTHVVRYSASNGNRFWVGSDGGLWRTDNGSTSFTNLNTGLNITQFYDVAVHPTDSGKIFGGAQDNSSSRRTTSSVWDVVTVTGDGFTNVVDPGNPNYVFIESYPSSGSTGYPRIYRSTNGGGVNGFSLLATTGIGSAAATFPWKTEIAILPAGGTSYLFTGSNTVFRANARQGSWSWTAISSNLASSVLSAFGTNLTTGSTLYVGFQNGRIFRTDNVLGSSPSWTEVTGNYPGGWVSDLAVDPAVPRRVFATRSVFGGSKLYRSTTGGSTWSAVGNGLPDVPANTVAIDPINRQRVFVGTDVGVFVSEDNGDTFVPQQAGMPLGNVITDLEIDNSPHVLTAGTYGRSAWQLSLPAESVACIPDGGVDDTLGQTSCCSGLAVSGSTVCINSADLNTCSQVCGSQPVGGCIPSGGIDDVLSQTSCCSGQAVAGSIWCLDAADYGSDWLSCVQTCQ